MPKKYSKTLIIQALHYHFKLSLLSISKLGINKGTVSNAINAKGVVSWDRRPAKSIVIRRLNNMVKKCLVLIDIFIIEDESSDDVYWVHIGKTKGFLSDKYLRQERRLDIKERIRKGQYRKIDLYTTPYYDVPVVDLIKKLK